MNILMEKIPKMDRNSIDLLNEIISIAENAKVDAEKNLKGNKTAGIRLRKDMQQIRLIAKDIRNLVQEQKSQPQPA